MSKLRRWIAGGVAAVLWIPAIHLFYRPDRERLVEGLSRRQVATWSANSAALRASNAEWDLMARTYGVLAFANLALRDGDRREEYLRAIDHMIDATLEQEKAQGMYFFLMPYARARPWMIQPARSVFIDGEIALMLGVRRVLRDEEPYRSLHRARTTAIAQRMRESGRSFSAESYPDEAWTFCNSIALVSLRLAEVLDGADHAGLIAGWLSFAKSALVDPRTGLLVSSYRLDGSHLDGPEGSSIFMVAHNLSVLDPAFAEHQWRIARAELIDSVAGFGYAREWPSSWTGAVDVDSGPTVPVLGANAGASGMAILGAAAFGDRERADALLASLELAAFPRAGEAEEGLRFLASNTLGDAVVLYALVQGPLWERVREMGEHGGAS